MKSNLLAFSLEVSRMSWEAAAMAWQDAAAAYADNDEHYASAMRKRAEKMVEMAKDADRHVMVLKDREAE